MRGKSLRSLALVMMGICMFTFPVACAEGEEVSPVVEAPAPAPEVAPASVEEAAPASTGEPAPAAPAEGAPAAEPAGAGEAVPTEDAPAEQETIGNDGLAPDVGTFDEEVPFTGSVLVELVNEGAVYFGDRVTLRANIRDVNTAFQIRWEVNCQDNNGWRAISDEQGSEYEFVVTPDNVNYEYRVVLVAEA